jgi:uncharacterized protein YecE (DUF72 family)
MPVWVGTSGWQYGDWAGAFYPPRLPRRKWLLHYAARFSTVELNATFYRLPKPQALQRCAADTPDDFVVAPKVSQYLSHMKQLRDPAEPVARFLERALLLGPKLGPLLLQLPERFHADPPRLARALDEFPGHLRVAVELRHDSWFTPEVREVLAARNAALVLADRRSRWVTPEWRTADWGYLRFHEGGGRWPCYGRTALAARAGTVERLWPDGEDVFAYFNNDPRCCAVRDARWFALACARRGLAPTRVPAPSDVRVAAEEP